LTEIPVRLRDKGSWRHVDGGLNLTKKRLGDFLYSLLSHGVHIGGWYVFDRRYRFTHVSAAIYLTKEMEQEVMNDCPWLILVDPPVISLN